MDVWFEIIKTVGSGVTLTLVLWLSKIPKSLRDKTQKLKENTDALLHLDTKIDLVQGLTNANVEKIKESQERLNVTDVVLSSLLKDSYSSAGIVQNKTSWPRIFDPGYRGPFKGKKKDEV